MKGYQIVIKERYIDAAIMWMGDNIYRNKIAALEALEREAKHLVHDDGYIILPNDNDYITGYLIEDYDGNQYYLMLENVTII